MIKLLLIPLLTFSLACSTIMKQEWEELEIRTEPAGAVVSLTGGITCHTPCTLELERQSDYSMTIEKPGYKKVSQEISGSSWDGWLWGNLAFLLFIPVAIGVDFYTGYAYDFDPSKFEVDLEKK